MMLNDEMFIFVLSYLNIADNESQKLLGYIAVVLIVLVLILISSYYSSKN